MSNRITEADKRLNNVYYDPVGGVTTTYPATGHEEHHPNNIILLNALPVSAFKNMNVAHIRIQYLGTLSNPDVAELVKRTIMNNNIVSYISHPATAQLLGVPTNKGFYTAKEFDAGLIFTLNKPQRNPQDQTVNPGDIDVYSFYVQGGW